MAYKILTKNGVQNTNIDGARDHNFNAGGRSGIVQGALNECNIFTSSSNTYAIDTGELRLCGHRVVITEIEYRTMLNTPSTDIRYSIVAQIIVESGTQEDYAVSFQFLLQNASTPLVQDDLDKNIVGTYQLELARFTYTTAGKIEDIVRTADLITGGSGDGQIADIEFNASAYELESNMEPEVSVDFNEETKKYDMLIGIPKGQDGLDGSGSNPNLLINGDFRVNQRGQSSYSAFANKYCVDRWLTRGNNVTVTPMDYGCSVSVMGTGQFYSVLEQIIEDSASLIGKTVTLSANIKSVSADLQTFQYCIRIRSYDVNNELIATSESWIINAGNYSCTLAVPSNTVKVSCLLYKNAVVDCTFGIEYMKLEIGSVATPYSPRPYAEELAMCQRYYEKQPVNSIRLFARSTSQFYYGRIIYSVNKRTNPTVTIYSNNNNQGKLNIVNSQTEIDIQSLYSTTYGIDVQAPNNDLVINNLYTGYYEADAEIY